LNCVSRRIIRPFHQTVKICSSNLDILPAGHQFFVSAQIIGYNSRSFAIYGTFLVAQFTY